MIIDIHPVNPETRLIARVASMLDSGGIVAYPTDSVYAIGCDASNNRAVERLHRLQNSDKHKPYALICRSLSEVADYAKVSNGAFRAMKQHLPGPYVFILEASRKVPKLLTDRRKTIGVRIPSNPVLRDLVEALGRPILSSSIKNEEGEFECDPVAIDKLVGAHLATVVRGEEVGHEPSSVVNLVGDNFEIVREGKGDVSFFRQG
jgi:tRNA threonylcarbamoyl adenosine modification protein (Sua5/YciO/YrdC/YwlC family)